MKKYLLGIFAIVLAVGFSSFGTTATYIFKYKGLNFQSATVQNKANWEQTSVLCSGTANKACLIEVTDIYTEVNVDGDRVLRTSAPNNPAIVATLGANGIDHVVSVPSSTGIVNQTAKP